MSRKLAGWLCVPPSPLWCCPECGALTDPDTWEIVEFTPHHCAGEGKPVVQGALCPRCGVGVDAGSGARGLARVTAAALRGRGN